MTLQVAGLQIGPYRDGDAYNHRMERLSALFDQALQEGRKPDLIVFPELMTVPYFCTTGSETFFELAEPADGPTFSYFSKKAKENNVHIIATIFEKAQEKDGTRYFNTAIVISNHGELQGYYRKTHIPKLTLPTLTTDETYYFNRGTHFPVFDVNGYKVGILICFDRSFPEAARALALQGADLIVIPTAASGDDRKKAWLAECQSRARENGVFVLGINRAGEERAANVGRSGLKFFGLTCAFDPMGNSLSDGLDENPWQIMSVTLDPNLIRETRERLNLLNHLQVDVYHAYSKEVQKVRSFPIEREITPLFGPKGVVGID
ncbi:carbon-nitrogen hydrolase family protein [Paenibacillus naphthalenovorans]|uniref:Acyltransferase n=2 Tax=Paenibacillus naphthalenovorans TaxID=162209 RepID=A0A0U2WE42_9BACL|nr:carbon-nitrogen hydrolase family protein [Paenibacillus naphthalenovorans]ALS23610.1 acyltransferase [Paenibacillus naphthalenovorans]GCL73448.1 carbon-nitrogen hydrolase family protein [Paenibacillus naphthalenovorans]SDJ31051.1 N-carbamoylputrescine amidase [Paenibacillus naphthalenovorans]